MLYLRTKESKQALTTLFNDLSQVEHKCLDENMKLLFIDPLDRPKATAGSDDYAHTCCPYVCTYNCPHFSKSRKITENQLKNNVFYWYDCVSVQGDHT